MLIIHLPIHFLPHIIEIDSIPLIPLQHFNNHNEKTIQLHMKNRSINIAEGLNVSQNFIHLLKKNEKIVSIIEKKANKRNDLIN